MIPMREKKTGGSSAKPKPSAISKSSRAETARRIRDIMGRTQTELASALGVSEKAIQSYEQGWRNVPVRVMIQLLVLLALYRKRSLDDIPCWEIRECPPARRDRCASFTVGSGQFCWFIGSKECHRPEAADSKLILPCMQCPVVKRLLSGKHSHTPDA
jgi:transcriptional regulator with XRE-family HTH domain